MSATHRFTYEYAPPGALYDDVPTLPETVDVQTEGEPSLDDLLALFRRYLMACGYNIGDDETLDVVRERAAEDPPPSDDDVADARRFRWLAQNATTVIAKGLRFERWDADFYQLRAWIDESSDDAE